MISEKEIWDALDDVKDPEIPRVSVVDMGIITGVTVNEKDFVSIKMTPTFAGCPALNVMRSDIEKRISELPVSGVNVDVNFDVQWNTNMITERGRELLKESDFALPNHHNGFVTIEMLSNIECPFCQSKKTILQTPFGPTQCRAIHYCNNCLQAFEQFKPV
ncbi:MAG: phenylacetate-CoA oxygenase subunit PaaJ [Bacteroidota bacterium]|nr:phenylacetate-CoA oxygenase subunit PaaJ [Bacteroidota bacterium]